MKVVPKKLKKAIGIVSAAVNKTEIHDVVFSNAKSLSNLLLEKISIMASMDQIQNNHNNLSVNPEEAEEWVFGLPAKNMTALYKAGSGKNRTCLKDMKMREMYKKAFSDLEKELQNINTSIKIATIELIISKANATELK